MRIPTAHGIPRVGLCRVSGKHLSDASNEPGVGSNSPLYKAFVDAAAARDERNAALAAEDRELIESDLAYAASKEADPFQQSRANDVGARELHLMRCQGLI